MEEITIYEKPTCSKCRVAITMLDEHGVPYHRVRYHDTPLTEAQLSSLIKKLGITPAELVRTTDPAYRALGIDMRRCTDREIIQLMVAHPDIMQRPILERGDRAIIGRPSERIIQFLEEK